MITKNLQKLSYFILLNKIVLLKYKIINNGGSLEDNITIRWSLN